MKKSLILVMLVMSISIFAQKNMSLLGKLQYNSSKGDLNDVWGYVDSQGNEYALVGLENGVSVVDVTVPTSPTEVFYTTGVNTIWRDLKVWNDKVYITNEGGNGLMIIDLSPLPGSTNLTVTNYTGNNYPFNSAHNLYIDENGICYVFGADYLVGGAIMLDLNVPTTNPNFELGVYNDYYLHDGFVRGDTLWGGAVNDGFFTVVDVSNKVSPVTMATQYTPHIFTHNAWLSDNGKYLFTTDEKSDAYIASYDVSNLSNISELDRIKSNPGSLVIPHNTHYMNDYLITSYYRDGVVIHDVSDPSNMVEVGNYDTSPLLSGNNFNGCWGVYPWLPSGNIIATDIEEGLYVLGANYVRACFVEGTVTDFSSGSPISNAFIEILSTTTIDSTNINGQYKTGIADAGTYDIVYSKSGYFPDTVKNVVLVNGQTNTINVQLKSMTPFAFTGKVIESSNSNPIPNAKVRLENNFFTFNVTTDVNGDFNIPSFYEGTYDIYVGKWAYKYSCTNNHVINPSTTNFTLPLDSGYEDNFLFDLGWSVNSTASTGLWERAVPIETNDGVNPVNPGVDAATDCGTLAYVTGNGGGGIGDDDIDGGQTILISPVFDLSNTNDPEINYERWFYNDGGFNSPNDSMIITLSNGVNNAVIEKTHTNTPNNSTWVTKNIKVKDFLTPTANMQIQVKAFDQPQGHLVEAGFDNFFITDQAPQSVNELSLTEISIYPNPFSNSFTVNLNKQKNNINLKLMDVTGKAILKMTKQNSSKIVVDVDNLSKGIYFLYIESNNRLIHTHKLIKN